MSGTPSRTFPTTRALPSRAESSNPIQNFPKQKHTTAGFPPPLPIRALPPKLESNLPLLHTPNPPSPEEVPRSPRPDDDGTLPLPLPIDPHSRNSRFPVADSIRLSSPFVLVPVVLVRLDGLDGRCCRCRPRTGRTSRRPARSWIRSSSTSGCSPPSASASTVRVGVAPSPCVLGRADLALFLFSIYR
jgi:hypothetical protein